MSVVHVVVPEGVDDPARPSGGNVYDQRLCRELVARGWSVHQHVVTGPWPQPAPADRAALGEAVADIPDGAVVIVDGLVASTAPELLVPEATRLRLVVLVHMPLGLGPAGDEEAAAARTREGAVLSAAAAVVTPSEWTRQRLLERHSLRPSRVHVAEPGVDPAGVAAGTSDGGGLLCVAAVVPDKGHDLLLAALATLRDRPWCCTCVGSLDRDPGFVDRLRRQARGDGIGDRVRFTGPRTGQALDTTYADADVLVLASRSETYGMVATEALARGLPVIGTAVGGFPEAVGRAPDGSGPGLLVPPDDSEALADAVACWLGDAELRRDLRIVAARRRGTLTGWSATVEKISRVLTEVR
ncbi:MAG TPA: glycosyltransferase family 4 protein [Nocardioidaceae bacterium]|nr:glycosyltransferase family 4 protein [Nocardioidaceae bacterium]